MGEVVRMSKEWSRKLLTEAGIRAGLAERFDTGKKLLDGRKKFDIKSSKPLHPHWFRHSRLTWASEHGWSGAEICAYFGVSMQTAEKVYIHPSQELGNTALMRTEGLKKQEPQEEAYANQVCSKCGDLNSKIATSCKKCGSSAFLGLKESLMKKEDELGDIRKQLSALTKLNKVLSLPGVMEAIREAEPELEVGKFD